jgi:hypothetical protein
MSDMLQLVVTRSHTQLNGNGSTNVRTTGKNWSEGFADLGFLSVGGVDDKLKHIGHSLTDVGGVESRGRRRQAEAYRTFVDRCRWR